VPVVVEADPRKFGNVIHGARVVALDELPAILRLHPGAMALVAVGVPEARPEIRAAAQAAGLREGATFFFLC
jgi:hypothetical protein